MEQKQNQKTIDETKASAKKELKQITKLCPFISSFLLEPKKNAIGEIELEKTTNVLPCIKNKCMFYNDTEHYCKIVKGLDELHFSFETDEDDTDEETNEDKIGATDNE